MAAEACTVQAIDARRRRSPRRRADEQGIAVGHPREGEGFVKGRKAERQPRVSNKTAHACVSSGHDEGMKRRSPA